MSLDKPYSPSCDRNREPILAVLRQHFADRHDVLEIGSGSGQHAVHFAAAMPWLRWQCSDVADNLPGIRLWLDEAALPNTAAPIDLDVARGPWPAQVFDAVFTANSLHIMGWAEVEALFAGVDQVFQEGRSRAPLFRPSGTFPLKGRRKSNRAALPSPLAGEGPLRAAKQGEGSGGVLVVYGPFNYGGDYTSGSNREFDGWLKARDQRSGIRDFEAVDALARAIGLRLVADVAMPANNRCLVWRRDAGLSVE